MSKPILTQAYLKSLFDYDPETGVFVRLKNSHRTDRVGKVAGSKSGNYWHISINKTYYQAHNFAWLWVTGSWPTNVVDHRNRVGTDNRFVNLRDVTASQNQHNLGINRRNTSGYRGVGWCKRTGLWQAQITAAGMHKHLGRYSSPEAASAAYLAAKAVYHPTAPI